MYLVTSREARLLDKTAIEEFGLPGIVLMENAARSIAAAAFDFWPHWPVNPTAAILGGPGQNGGDGWALARIFSSAGFRVQCCLVKGAGKEIGGDAAVNFNTAQKLGLPFAMIESDDAADSLGLERFDLIVDALFGTGLDRPLAGTAAALLKAAAAARTLAGPRSRVLAVDLPSGLSGDTGDLWGPPLAADLTVTLGAPKVGLYLKEGPSLAGRIVVGDIGLTPEMFARATPMGRLSEKAELAPYLPCRPINGHKGSFGHVMLAGGARGKTGALCLAALGALRSGAALATALHPASLGSVIETKLTEVMSLELPEAEPGELAAAAGELILRYAAGRQSLAVGPGLGLGEGALRAVLSIVEKASLPLVLDADALTHLAGRLEDLKKCPAPAILTPHPGEAGRLLSVGTKEIQDDRLGAARAISSRSGCVTVLKGHNTIISAPDGRFFLNAAGGPHLAVGGSGDLLTGLIAGLLAQKMAPFPAAALAVWIHSRAADMCRDERGPFGLTPTEFSHFVPRAFRELADWREQKCQ
ncbi:MAG: NAD(P)H-hydrate dehydratase [Candidatus Adiutrix sp.]|nr:NAD(P)H-hydrate dehydratase [Candidatus Adiutrix sp.]